MILQGLRIQLWDILQSVLEVKIPFLGIPLEGVNNPILVVNALVEVKEKQLVKVDIFKQFAEEFNEAVGFNCAKPSEYWDQSIPFSSYYVYLTNQIAQKSIEKCNLPISEKEKFEIITLIDEALFPNNYLIKALRTAQQYNSQILYREGEEPIEVSVKPLKIKVLTSYPFYSKPRYIDNSLIHLLGVIPLKYIKDNLIDVVQLENGLWSAIYSFPYPQVKNWKWIWDLNLVTLIEFSSLENA